MNICVIEDNTLEAEYVSKMSLEACDELNMPTPNIFCFYTSEEFITWNNRYNHVIDICFLDVNLKGDVNGIEIAKIIKEKNYNTLIIFMTSYDSYFRDMVQVEPFRFLSKPFQYDDFYKVFVDIRKRITLQNFEQDCTYKFKNSGITYSIKLKDVIYISSYKRKILISDVHDQHMEFYGKLDDVEIEIKALTTKFIRINKSYLFNKDFIENIGKNSISVCGITYQVSPKYKYNVENIT